MSRNFETKMTMLKSLRDSKALTKPMLYSLYKMEIEGISKYQENPESYPDFLKCNPELICECGDGCFEGEIVWSELIFNKKCCFNCLDRDQQYNVLKPRKNIKK